ncbi:L-cysteine desulfidase [Caminicella sporogenes DSM 14501]|uniref:UPF0597 protein SAMN02745883_01710 n=1 Tax=Caminicella sporogenes DSM 14501 TaxID=1121266 RepID=A0A1M6R6E8_9FIRM|nr:L-serine ammonia-lyase, iron-sulfur-dependent, subunit alpha [Caminicella sporogenes]RKD27319.1 hypothetical protein BET04_09295 [Caminicella sporogenes]SHK27980.1 L-cysteine desulfidase [Caminicella sporogenes DSM 14501]
MDKKKIIIETLKREVVPAMGCTEPVAVALAASKAKEVLSEDDIKEVSILVSPNIYKNGLCVGIPNTDEVGLYIAGALGIVAGKSEKDLRVLEGIKDSEVLSAKKMLENDVLKLDIKDTDEKIYIEVFVRGKKGSARVIVKERHNKFVYIEKDNEVLFKEEQNKNGGGYNEVLKELYSLRIRDIIKAIEKIDYKDIEFLLEGIDMNEKIAKAAIEKTYGIGVGAGFYENIKNGVMADDFINNAMMLTAAGADARMSGLNMPVMSSNGSGNNGLTAILPLVAYKNIYDVDEEKLSKALAISHIINGYIKYYIGRLSPLCGCGVAAATGASAAIAWLMGADYDKIDGTIKNMIANISGMICDGAKVGCALKLATSAATAIQSAILAINGRIVPPRNGIVAETAEDTIKNLGMLGQDGMNITDRVILSIMQKMEKAV